MLAGTDAGTGLRAHVGVWGGFFSLAAQDGGGQGGEGRRTHRLPFSDLPLKECPIVACCRGGVYQEALSGDILKGDI